MRRSSVCAASVLFGILVSGRATQAVDFTYDLGSGSSVSAYGGGGDSGLTVETRLATNLEGQAFTLGDGDSYTFDFFRIWTNEESVGSDDLVERAITARLDFEVPDADVVVGGVTVGGKAGFFGNFQWGYVTWDGPVDVVMGDRSFRIELSNETFNEGILWGTWSGQARGAWVQARVTQVSSSAMGGDGPTSSVPDGGLTLALLGASVAVIGVLHRTTRYARVSGE